MKVLRSERGIVGLVAVLLAVYPAGFPYDIYHQTVMLLAFLLAIQAVSWNIISGYAGYVSLGHSVFLGLGGYAAAIAATRLGIHPLWMAPFGALVVVVVAMAVSLVVLRRRSHA